MPRSFDCIIIGGGCSGTMLLFHLSQHAQTTRQLSVAIFESDELGPGVPYQTTQPLHVLNVPAGRMSAIAAEGDHFLSWYRAQGHATASGGDFVARGEYGKYLRHLAAIASERISIEHIRSQAMRLETTDGGVKVVAANGGEFHGKQAVLAWGHNPPRIPREIDESARQHPGYINNPWRVNTASSQLERGALLIGTGLTMIDCAVSIAGQSPDYKMLAISRRGLMPQPHRHHDAPPRKLPPPPIAYWPTSTPGLLKAIRAYVLTCRNRDFDWREAITALRPVTSQLWQGLSTQDKQRFLEKLVPYWDSHRHRVAPQVAARADQLQTEGRLEVAAARLVRVHAAGDLLEATILDRGASATRALQVGCVVNCTGPETDVRRSENSLVKQMLESKLIAPDVMRLGIECDEHGHPTVDGQSQSRLWTIGPVRKAQLWETIAVPEIRVQAEELATKLITAVA